MIGCLIGVHASNIVNDVIRKISILFFLWKIFEHMKMQIKPKPTNKTKLNKQKTIFRAEKLLRERKLFILHFLKKNWNCPDNLIYFTTHESMWVSKNHLRSSKMCKNKSSGWFLFQQIFIEMLGVLRRYIKHSIIMEKLLLFQNN